MGFIVIFSESVLCSQDDIKLYFYHALRVILLSFKTVISVLFFMDTFFFISVCHLLPRELKPKGIKDGNQNSALYSFLKSDFILLKPTKNMQSLSQVTSLSRNWFVQGI